jgi:hypothetical protein
MKCVIVDNRLRIVSAAFFSFFSVVRCCCLLPHSFRNNDNFPLPYLGYYKVRAETGRGEKGGKEEAALLSLSVCAADRCAACGRRQTAEG